MRNSLLKQLFQSYVITLIIGFSLLGLIVSKLFNQQLLDEKKALMIEQGEKISKEIVMSLYTGQIDDARLNESLEFLHKFLDAQIWLVDQKGQVYGVSSEEEEIYLGTMLPEEILDELNKKQIVTKQGRFYNQFSKNMLTIAYPIMFRGQVTGSILLHASLSEIEQNMLRIYKLIAAVIFVTLAAAYGVLYVQTRKIIKPIKEMKEGARIISQGAFRQRISVNASEEIEELAQSFNEMAESIEKTEEKRRKFIADLTHDLRSPMTSIAGFIEGILDGVIPNEQQRKYLNIVLQESKRLIKMVNNLLELTQIQQGEVAIHKEKTELHELIKRIIVSFEAQVSNKNIHIECIWYSEQCWVLCDTAMIQRVIVNLLDNAIKFTPENHLIQISTKKVENKIYVQIRNTGIGLTESMLKQIWERFHKGDISRGKDKTGFGLGLSIVREIVLLHRENISVESVPDEYVQFTFTLEAV